MNSYSNETYGQNMAGIYDEWFPDYDQHAIDALADLARNGKALELGVGTGRFALPLSGKGVEVHGIDAAPSMISRLRAKPDSDRITVTEGNFADVAGQSEGGFQRWESSSVSAPDSLRMAFRVGPDGSACGLAFARALE